MDGGPVPGADGAERAARAAAHEAAPWIEGLARLGFAAKGAVYILVGGLAASAAFTGSGQTTDSSGALATLTDQEWGRALLGVIAVGLAGYVLWRAVSALLNPENDSAGKRLFYGVTALIYAGLAVEAARLALTGGGGGGGDGADHWSATLMSQPFGQILVAIVGLGAGLYGLQQIWNAWRVDLDERLDLRAMSAPARTWTVRLGRFGLAARGLVLAIIGGSFFVAAFQAQPTEARGVGEALDLMDGTPWLLGIVALGLIAYALYQFVRARYRRITPA